jgi:hypothetical protein
MHIDQGFQGVREIRRKRFAFGVGHSGRNLTTERRRFEHENVWNWKMGWLV